MEMKEQLRRLNAERHIMLLFVSLVSERSFKSPVVFPGINASGRDYIAIQTNEAAIVKAKALYGDALQDIFLLVSPEARAGAEYLRGESHVAYLERRMVNQFPDLAGHFHHLPYGDAAENMDRNLLDIAAIVERIRSYALSSEASSVMVHADMTGGMRHASMMMLSILELLKYDGLEIGDVFYTDLAKHRVYEATQIQRMFTLISGVDEFVRFGSVNALRDYFRNKRMSIELRALLDAMEEFSGMIKVCYTGYIRSALANLNEAMEEFAARQDKDLQEKLFDGLLETIYDHYGGLLSGEAGELDIIRWCVENDFLQQAITLCTEWLPAYMIDSKIAYTDSEAVRQACVKAGKFNNRDWKREFIINCQIKRLPATKASPPKEDIIKKLRVILNKSNVASVRSNAFAELVRLGARYPRIAELTADYHICAEDFMHCRATKSGWEEFGRRYAGYHRALRHLYYWRANDTNYRKSFVEFCNGFSHNKLLSQFAVAPADVLRDLFELREPEVAQAETMQELKPLPAAECAGKPKKWPQRYKAFCAMYEGGVLKSKLPSDEMLRCLMAYHTIRLLRNDINHANAERDYIPLGQIKQHIMELVELLERANSVVK